MASGLHALSRGESGTADWLAQNLRYPHRFVQPVGTLCRDISNKIVAQPQHLHEHTVKNIDRRYRQA